MSRLEKLLHDLTNIAQVIGGNLELVREQDDEYVRRAREAMRTLYRLIRQLRKLLE